MLSGVGQADNLPSFDIRVIQDLPGVGQNLLDDITCYGIYKTKPDYELDSLKPRIQLYLRYLGPVLGDQRNSIMLVFNTFATQRMMGNYDPVGFSLGHMMYLREGRGETHLH